MSAKPEAFEVGQVFQQDLFARRRSTKGRVRVVEVDVDPLMPGYRTAAGERYLRPEGPWYRVEGVDWDVPQPVLSHQALEQLWVQVDEHGDTVDPGHVLPRGVPPAQPRRCRHCGCTDQVACTMPIPGTRITRSCSWAGADTCTACLPGADPNWQHPDRLLRTVIS